jgi:hypothetical protein
MTPRKLVDGSRRHYGQSPGKRPGPKDLDRIAATMARAIEKERKQEAKKHG